MCGVYDVFDSQGMTLQAAEKVFISCISVFPPALAVLTKPENALASRQVS
jgi:hypothetical protein